MKTKERNGPKNNAARTILIAVIGLALLAAVVLLPLYRANLAAQASPSVNSLPTRLLANPDGSVSVSFQGEAGALYQIYYSDGPADSPEKMQWTLAADPVIAGANTWTEWVDAGDASRVAPALVLQRYYRVVLKSFPTVSVTPQPVAPPTSTFIGISAPLRLATLQGIAELGRLLAGGAQSEAELIKELATTPVTVAKLFELAEQELPGNVRGAQLIYEAILGPKVAQATEAQQAEAQLYLGNCHGNFPAGRLAEAIAHYLEAARLQPNGGFGWLGWNAAGSSYRLLGKYAQARECWAHVNGRPDAGEQAEFAQWLIGLSHHEEGNFAQSLIEFQKLAEGYTDRSWQADGLYWQGEALRKLGRQEEAKAAYLKVTELKNELPADSPLRPAFDRVAGWTLLPLAQIEPPQNPEGSSH